MKTLVIYDITDDKVRYLVADACKNFGLSRIQKSAFLGHLPSGRRKEMIELLAKRLGGSEGNIQVFVICDADLALRVIIGREYVVEEEAGDIIL